MHKHINILDGLFTHYFRISVADFRCHRSFRRYLLGIIGMAQVVKNGSITMYACNIETRIHTRAGPTAARFMAAQSKCIIKIVPHVAKLFWASVYTLLLGSVLLRRAPVIKIV